jgi:hypothetical protein
VHISLARLKNNGFDADPALGSKDAARDGSGIAARQSKYALSLRLF